MNITELRNKRNDQWEMMSKFLDTHRNSMGVLSAEDDATYARMESELDAMTNEIKRMERRDAFEAELNRPVTAPITGTPEKTAQISRKRPAERPMPTRRTSTVTFAAERFCTTSSPPRPTRTADSSFPPTLRSPSLRLSTRRT